MKSTYRMPVWMGLVNWIIIMLLTGIILPFFDVEYWTYHMSEPIKTYFFKAADVGTLSAIFTFLPMLVILLILWGMNNMSLQRRTYWLLFSIQQAVMAVVTFMMIDEKGELRDVVFTAGCVITVLSLATWGVTFLLRRKTTDSKLVTELIDEDEINR